MNERYRKTTRVWNCEWEIQREHETASKRQPEIEERDCMTSSSKKLWQLWQMAMTISGKRQQWLMALSVADGGAMTSECRQHRQHKPRVFCNKEKNKKIWDLLRDNGFKPTSRSLKPCNVLLYVSHDPTVSL